MGYQGPGFNYAPMPDQYMFAALQRLELAKAHRRPLFAEVDTVSSHMPWDRIPQMIPWNNLGNGSIFNRLPVDREPRLVLVAPRPGEGRLRPLARVLAEHADLVRPALRQEESRARRRGRRAAAGDRERPGGESRRADLGHRSRPLGAQADRWVGLAVGAAAQPARADVADERVRDRFLTAYGPRRTTGSF